ncbi:hypothetical protein QTJ16_005861 [Diplocarpon rosae]|uniref:Uncharacterized protein n=1 Tax=Diplocarpon rosae TaxID=946125 RepID=A0AAD9SU68_9HELO|nr:hypothetical protein QTJ16_005861 [Diplocarpon rosae]
MDEFGSTNLASKFAIILGSLVALAFLAGFIKLCFNKRRLTQHLKKTALEVDGKTDEEKLAGKQVGEGDLFGIRALEHGFFGGVSQTRSSSSTPLYALSPSTTVVDWERTGHLATSSASSSVLALPQCPAPPTNLGNKKQKPFLLGLQPSNAKGDNGGSKLDASTAGAKGGSYMPSSSYPLSPKSTSPTDISFEKGKSPVWISPLDLQLNRPSTLRSRPALYLPNLQFNGEIEETGVVLSSRPSRGSPTSVFPADDDNPRPSSRMNSGMKEFIGKPGRLDDLAPQMVTADPNNFPIPDTGNWNPTPRIRDTSEQSRQEISPSRFPKTICYDNKFPPSSSISIFQDSIVSHKRVSSIQPAHIREIPSDAQSLNQHDVVASSMYSNSSSILKCNNDSSMAQSRARQQGRSTSTTHKRYTSSISLARTLDSLRQHSRKLSSDSKRRSRGRDTTHYDANISKYTRAALVQGRAVDLDHPCESPLYNENAFQHSRDTSVSYSSSRKGSATRENE